MIKSQVIILGGGVSGIACARTLQSANIDYLLIEGSGQLGGRLRSDHDSGYIFDHGFQVFLSCYDVTKSLIGNNLTFGSFSPGAAVYISGKRYQVADPLREPALLLETLKAPIGSCWDKLLMIKLKLISAERALGATHYPVRYLRWLRSFVGGVKTRFKGLPTEHMTTAEYLKGLGFSQRVIDSFFRPFLGGIFLDSSLSTSADVFLQVFGNFSRGQAQLPDGGMEGVAKALAAPLDQRKIILNKRVVNFTADKVVLASGDMLQAKNVVSALDADSLRLIKPYLNLPASRSVSCFYFSSDAMPELGKYLILNSTRVPSRQGGDNSLGNGGNHLRENQLENLINNLAPLSNVNPSYAPPGKLNLSISVLGDYSDEISVASELHKIFPGKKFEFLKKYIIRGALPDQGAHTGLVLNPKLEESDLKICGDFLCSTTNKDYQQRPDWQKPLAASIETAVRSGVNAAYKIINNSA